MSSPSADSVRFCEPDADALHAVASLRWDWAIEIGNAPLASRTDFIDEFVAWCSEHASTHRCIVGVDEADAVVAFGFVAITDRVPAGHLRGRRTVDIQSVYVRPDRRNGGVGGLLIEHLIDEARNLGAEHITVHSSRGAVTAYHRAGFSLDPQMLYRVP